MAHSSEAFPAGRELEDPYAAGEGAVLISGLQALVRLPMDQRRMDIAAGLCTAGFVTGYPGSPLAGYDAELAREQDELVRLGIVHQPALNEELAATAVAGSQLVSAQPGRNVEGVAALWYGKAPGLDRAGDAIRHGNLMGASPHGGVLVCVGDDPQAKSSSVPSTSEPTLYGLGLPVLAPADPREVLSLGLQGFSLSRASGLWVGVRIPASVADAVQTMRPTIAPLAPVPANLRPGEGSFVHSPTAQLLGATLIELERSLYGPRLETARAYATAAGLDRVTAGGPDDVLGVVAAGPAYLSVRHALGQLGLDEPALPRAGVRILKIAMPYPLDAGVVRQFAKGLREVVVVEDKRGFLETLVRDALYGMSDAPGVVGKLDEEGRTLIPSTGEVDADTLPTVLAARLLRLRELPEVRHAVEEASRARTVDSPLSLARTAYFCSGCPHNTGVKVPASAMVGSGSGCHGLAIQMAPSQAGNVVGRFQMGGEGAMWNGMAPFVSADHFFQNLGDGTFAHSGSQAIRASVASGVDITYKILSNSVVAMTGGQAIPGGRSLADLSRLLLAEGVKRIIVTTDDRRRPEYAQLPKGVEVWDRRRIVEAEEELARVRGVTVLVHSQECAVERRHRNRQSGAAHSRRVFINPLACDGCGDCGAKSNCVSVRPVRSRLGSRTEIHQESCNFDFTCLEGDCPAMLTVEPTSSAPAQVTLRSADMPRRHPVGDARSFTVRITGLGGTGVLTTARIIATAAALSGLSVRGLDQTGIAQKGGAVCSDLRVGPAESSESHRLSAGECNLYLGCDLLVAAEPRHLVVAAPERTSAVMSTYAVPTGREVADRSISPPAAAELRARVERRTEKATSVWVDAQELSRQRFGSDLYANILLVGVACQRGTLPLEPERLEEAIRRHGADPETNLQAFRYGRLVWAGLDRADQEPARDAGVSATHEEKTAELICSVGAPQGGELEKILDTSIPDLAAYQDHAYARRYAETVARCRQAEEAGCGTADGPFAQTVAVQLHRLMAYRDEYEVARLHRSPLLRAEIAAKFGPGARVRYHLHPPLLARLGRKSKVSIGPGAAVAFGLLASLRRLRQSPFDPFGQSPLRRLEREVRDRYEEAVSARCVSLGPDNLAGAVALAALPAAVRGYGQVKARALEACRAELEALSAGGDRVSIGPGPLLGASVLAD